MRVLKSLLCFEVMLLYMQLTLLGNTYPTDKLAVKFNNRFENASILPFKNYVFKLGVKIGTDWKFFQYRDKKSSFLLFCRLHGEQCAFCTEVDMSCVLKRINLFFSCPIPFQPYFLLVLIGYLCSEAGQSLDELIVCITLGMILLTKFLDDLRFILSTENYIYHWIATVEKSLERGSTEVLVGNWLEEKNSWTCLRSYFPL